jgi:CRISPR-associated endonuclease/helicase Cas3
MLNPKFIRDIPARGDYDSFATILKSLGISETDYGKTPLSNGSYIKLIDHTYHVWEKAEDYLDQRVPLTISSEFQRRFGVSLKSVIFNAVIYHDLGKAHPQWQNAAMKNKLITVDMRHEIISVLSYGVTPISSVELDADLLVIIAIAAHHSKLKTNQKAKEAIEKTCELAVKKSNINWSNTPFIQTLKEKSQLYRWFEEVKNRMKNSSEDYVYYISLIRHILQYCDKEASKAEQGLVLPDFINWNYKFPFESKRSVQELVHNSNSKITILRAPTGAGKTHTALLWIDKHIKAGRVNRGIICMPTQFTTNALASAASYAVEGTGLSFMNAKHITNFDKLRIEASQYLEAPLTVCTIDHILNAFSLAHEKHHGIISNLMNSCIVIDEVDFFDNYVQMNMVELMKFVDKFDIPILIMSATVVDSYPNFIKTKTGITDVNLIDDTSDLERDRINVIDITEQSEDTLKECLYEYIEKINNQSTLIYANTVKRANLYRDSLIELGVDESKIVLYHSRFILTDKKNIQSKVLSFLGEDAWKNGDPNKIVIATQIAELSLNISADFIISDICPYDRFVQRMGRGSRFDRSKVTDVLVIKPMKNGKLYALPYVNKKDDNNKYTQPSEILQKTIDTLQKTKYNAHKYLMDLNTIYGDVINFYDSGEKNAKELRSIMKNNIILKPAKEIEDDNYLVSTWQCRDISEPNYKVAVYPYDETYRYYSEFNKHGIFNTVDVSKYEFDKCREEGIIIDKKVKVGSTDIMVYEFNPTRLSEVYTEIGGYYRKGEIKTENIL